jgi:hypothetical protein
MRHKCNSSCTNAHCVQSMSINTIDEFRKKLWGDNPSPLERRRRLLGLFEDARVEYTTRLQLKQVNICNYSKPMCFCVNGQIVCENAFAYLINMSTKGKKSRVWYNVMDRHINGDNVMLKLVMLC